MRRFVPFVAAAAVASWALFAHAQKSSAVALTWIAPEGCPTESAVEAEIARLLGDSSSERKVVATAKVAKIASGFRVALTTNSNGAGARTIDAGSCQALADATALIVALMVDPAAATVAPTPAPASAPAPAPAPEPAPEPAPASAPVDTPSIAPTRHETPESPARSRWLLAASALADTGALPRPALGFGFAVAWASARVRIEGSFAYLPGARVVLADRDAGGDFRLALGGALGCYTLAAHDSGVALAGCGGAEVGRMSASGFGVRTPHQGAATWLAASAGLLTTYTRGDLALRFQLDALAPLARPEFVLDGVGAVHTPSAVTARVLLGAEVRFL